MNTPFPTGLADTQDACPTQVTRRGFIRQAMVAGTAASSFVLRHSPAADTAPTAPTPQVFTRKIKLGVVGNGGRGAWIAKPFKRHGGYEMWAVADHFQEVADACGEALGVDKPRRFSTPSGYQRLIESPSHRADDGRTAEGEPPRVCLQCLPLGSTSASWRLRARFN
jgi:hypothetical protein